MKVAPLYSLVLVRDKDPKRVKKALEEMGLAPLGKAAGILGKKGITTLDELHRYLAEREKPLVDGHTLPEIYGLASQVFELYLGSNPISKEEMKRWGPSFYPTTALLVAIQGQKARVLLEEIWERVGIEDEFIPTRDELFSRLDALMVALRGLYYDVAAHSGGGDEVDVLRKVNEWCKADCGAVRAFLTSVWGKGLHMYYLLEGDEAVLRPPHPLPLLLSAMHTKRLTSLPLLMHYSLIPYTSHLFVVILPKWVEKVELHLPEGKVELEIDVVMGEALQHIYHMAEALGRLRHILQDPSTMGTSWLWDDVSFTLPFTPDES